MPYTNRQKLSALKRELSYRRYVYPQRVEQGKMTRAAMDDQIGVFEEMQADYEDLVMGDEQREAEEQAKGRLL
jgi:hypothetical protein